MADTTAVRPKTIGLLAKPLILPAARDRVRDDTYLDALDVEYRDRVAS